MLKSLNIQNYALIDSLELTWQPGMSRHDQRDRFG